FCRLVEGHSTPFTVAALRELAERAFEQARAGTLDPDGLVRSVNDDSVRTQLSLARAELAKASLADSAERQLRFKLDRHTKMSGLQEHARKYRATPRVPKS